MLAVEGMSGRVVRLHDGRQVQIDGGARERPSLFGPVCKVDDPGRDRLGRRRQRNMIIGDAPLGELCPGTTVGVLGEVGVRGENVGFDPGELRRGQQAGRRCRDVGGASHQVLGAHVRTSSAVAVARLSPR
jgi:hypothetical protein